MNESEDCWVVFGRFGEQRLLIGGRTDDDVVGLNSRRFRRQVQAGFLRRMRHLDELLREGEVATHEDVDVPFAGSVDLLHGGEANEASECVNNQFHGFGFSSGSVWPRKKYPTTMPKMPHQPSGTVVLRTMK